jgi:hypothetical protein
MHATRQTHNTQNLLAIVFSVAMHPNDFFAAIGFLT